MELLYDELRKELDRLSLDATFIVFYRTRDFFIDPNSTPGHGEPAEWFPSTVYSGADVYVWEDIEREFKMPIILHEVIEADLRIYQEFSKDDSHNIAKEFDKRYAKELLSGEFYKDYEANRDLLEALASIR